MVVIGVVIGAVIGVGRCRMAATIGREDAVSLTVYHSPRYSRLRMSKKGPVTDFGATSMDNVQNRSLKDIGKYYGGRERPSASFIANVSSMVRRFLTEIDQNLVPITNDKAI